MSANDKKSKRSSRDGLTAGFRYCRVDGLSVEEVARIEHLLDSGEAANFQPPEGKVYTVNNFNRNFQGGLEEIAFFIWITIHGPANTGQTRWKYDPAKSMVYAYNSEGREFWKRSTKQMLPEALRPIIGTEVKNGRLKIPQEEQDLMFAKLPGTNGNKPEAAQSEASNEAKTEPVSEEAVPEPEA